MAKKYYSQGIDEIFFMDAVAAYYDRNSLTHIVEKACSDQIKDKLTPPSEKGRLLIRRPPNFN